MSKIFIISNTNFNISKYLSTKEWLKIQREYFYDEFIPYLKSNMETNDILIHLGNFLCKSKSIDLDVLNFIQELFHDLRTYLPVFILKGENDELILNSMKYIRGIGIIKEPVEIKLMLEQKFLLCPYNTKPNDINDYESDYCFFNFDYINSEYKDIYISRLKKFKKCYCGFYDKNNIYSNIKNLAGPYNINGDDKKGFIVLETHTNTDKFIINKKSPNFKSVSIVEVSDLNISDDIFHNNFIHLSINKKLLIEHQLEIDIICANKNIISISYTDNELVEKNEIILNESAISLTDMVLDYISKTYDNKDELIEEFEKLIKLNKR